MCGDRSAADSRLPTSNRAARVIAPFFVSRARSVNISAGHHILDWDSRRVLRGEGLTRLRESFSVEVVDRRVRHDDGGPVRVDRLAPNLILLVECQRDEALTGAAVVVALPADRDPSGRRRD